MARRCMVDRKRRLSERGRRERPSRVVSACARASVDRDEFSYGVQLWPKEMVRLALLAMAVFLSGCVYEAPPSLPDAERIDRNAESNVPAKLPRETYDIVFLKGAKVGFTVTRTEAIQENGQKLVRTSQETKMEVNRFGGSTQQQILLVAVEMPRGDVVRLESSLTAGGKPATVVAKPTGNKLVLESSTSGQVVVSEIPWQPRYGGFFAPEREMRQKPMQPGEKRSIEHFFPILNKVVRIDLEAGDYETTELLDSKAELLKVKGKVHLAGGQSLESDSWCDRAGETLKTEMLDAQQVSYRTTKERALAVEAKKFDLAANTSVPIAQRLNNPHRTRRIVYRARLKHGDPAKIFPEGLSQRVRAIDKSTVGIEVVAIRPSHPAELPKIQIEPATPDDLASNNYLQVDDRRIQGMAKLVAKDEKEPWKIAVALEDLVHRSVRNEGFSQALVTAAETAESLTGDCTEHAMLLATLCRARQIPSRIVTGLVYYAPLNGFAYHMWTEVWIVDRWVPLDATLGLGGIGSGHIKLSDSNMKGADALSAFLPVAQVMGSLELSVEKVE